MFIANPSWSWHGDKALMLFWMSNMFYESIKDNIATSDKEYGVLARRWHTRVYNVRP